MTGSVVLGHAHGNVNVVLHGKGVVLDLVHDRGDEVAGIE